MAESVRAKAEELRTRVRTRVEEIHGGHSSPENPILGKLGIMKGPLVTEIREKGVVATARERVAKVRGKGGFLGGSSLLGESSPEKVAVEKDTGAIKLQRRRIAIEG